VVSSSCLYPASASGAGLRQDPAQTQPLSRALAAGIEPQYSLLGIGIHMELWRSCVEADEQEVPERCALGHADVIVTQ
jgi:hypothetical protein